MEDCIRSVGGSVSPSALHIPHRSCPADSNRPEQQETLGTLPDEMPFLGCDETGFATLALCPSGLYSLWLRELPRPRQLNGSDLGLVDPIPTVLALESPPNQSLAIRHEVHNVRHKNNTIHSACFGEHR